MKEKWLAGVGGWGAVDIGIATCLRLVRTCRVLSQQPDSGFFCEDNSSDEDVILKEEFRGVIIKQGCLLKQVSVQHYPSSLFKPSNFF